MSASPSSQASSAAPPGYFVDQKKGEVNELKQVKKINHISSVVFILIDKYMPFAFVLATQKYQY